MIRHRGWLYLIPWLIPTLALARPAKPAPRPAAPQPSYQVQMPINSQSVDNMGTTYLLTGVLTLTVTPPPPPPPPPPVDPLTISAVVVVPNRIVAGAGATGTVTLSRSPGTAVSIGLLAEKGLMVDPAVTILPGQTAGTFAVKTTGIGGTWLSVTASYNGQSRLASVFVQAAAPPPPPPPATGAVPQVNAYRLADGTPLVGRPALGSEVRIVGQRFGATAGRVLWQGAEALPVLSWSDTEIRVRIPAVSALSGWSLWVARADGAYCDMQIPTDMRQPLNARRR